MSDAPSDGLPELPAFLDRRAAPDRRPINAITIGHRHRRDLGDVDSLAASMDELGLLQPIVVTPDGKLVAGERRLRAAQKLGWTHVPVHVVDIASIIAGEAAENFERKDFTPSEAVAIMRELEPDLKAAAAVRQKAGRPLGNLPEGGRVLERVAAHTGVGRRTLEKAAVVVAAAEEQPERYGRLVADMDRLGRVDGTYRRLLNMRQAEALRAAPPPLPQGPFSVVAGDPPWPYEIRNADPSHRGIHPYPTMSVADICAMPIAALASPNALLWLWTTNFGLVNGTAKQVIDACGFRPGTLMTWIKNHPGYGHWLKGQSEQVILAVRGSPVIADGHNFSTAFCAPVTRHSEKPDAFYALVESLCPAPPGGYLELFARRTRPGWITWGDEVRDYDSDLNSARSYDLAIQALREKRIRSGEIAPRAGDEQEKRWAKEGPREPRDMESVR